MLCRLTTCLTVHSLLFVSPAPLNTKAPAVEAAGAKARKKGRSKVAPEFAGAAARA